MYGSSFYICHLSVTRNEEQTDGDTETRPELYLANPISYIQGRVGASFLYLMICLYVCTSQYPMVHTVKNYVVFLQVNGPKQTNIEQQAFLHLPKHVSRDDGRQQYQHIDHINHIQYMHHKLQQKEAIDRSFCNNVASEYITHSDSFTIKHN